MARPDLPPPDLPRRLPGRITNAARPAIPPSPINPARRFSFEGPNGGRRKPVACVVVAVTWTGTGVDPFKVIEVCATVQVARVGAPLQLSATVGVKSGAGARSTVN